MTYLFYFIAFLQLVFSWRSLVSGSAYLNFFRSELSEQPSGLKPFASVIVPCKGLDPGLEMNLAAMLGQDYPDYEVIFALEDEADAAGPVISSLMRSSDRNSRVVIAGEASGSGQKVHNLLVALDDVADRTEVLVFADSDARPSPEWLGSLVSAAPEGSGCASGYRWFFADKGGLATQLRSVWNASIASALGPDQKNNFSWGGSTAIRRDVFESAGVRNAWRGALSDDFALTSAVKAAGGGVRFVPACLTATVEDCTFRELLEFTTRQMKITRVYSKAHWLISFVGAGLWSISIALAFYIVASAGSHAYLALTFLALVFAAGTAKSWLRLKAVRLALPGQRDRLKAQTFWQMTLWAITPFLFLFNDVVSMFSNRIVWRGIEYELESPEHTRVVSRNG